MIETIYSNPELYHSGVKGQKWGQRRYQNPDGTWTEEGKRRRRIGDGEYDEYDDYRPRKQINKKKALMVGLGVAGGALAAYKIAKDPKKAYEYFHKKAVAAGDAMVDAAMISIGTIAISKLASELGSKEGQSEGEKAANKVLLDMGTAGIKSITGSPKGNNNNTNGKDRRPPTKEQGKQISELIGPPKQKDIDRSSARYQALFKNSNGDSRSPEERATIKSLASAGYGIDQIEEYLKLNNPPF